MKKFKLSDLELQSFVTTLDEAKKEMIKGGASVTGKSNPTTDEIKEITCTKSPSDTTGGKGCQKGSNPVPGQPGGGY